MKPPLLPIALGLITASLVGLAIAPGSCLRRPTPAVPVATPDVLPVPIPHHVDTAAGYLLGFPALTAEFKIDEFLRLEVLVENAAALKSTEKLGTEVKDAGLGPFEVWPLEADGLSGALNAAMGDSFLIQSGAWEFTTSLEGLELWHDTTTEQWYLFAVFPMPADVGALLESLWTGVKAPIAAAPPEDTFSPDTTLDLRALPGLTTALLDRKQALDETEIARLEAAPELPLNFMPPTITAGDFVQAPGGEAVVMLSNHRDGGGWEHELHLWDPEGDDLLVVPSEGLEPLQGERLVVSQAVDLTGDGLHEAVVLAQAAAGPQRILVWSFAGGEFRDLPGGSRWGAGSQVPHNPEWVETMGEDDKLREGLSLLTPPAEGEVPATPEEPKPEAPPSE